MDSTKLPRGIRNNNPLNLRRTCNVWLGAAEKLSDKFFVEFKSPEYGIRAALINIHTWARRKGIRRFNVSQLINIWAPPTENFTEKYIKAVCEKTGLAPETIIFEGEFKGRLLDIVKAMVCIENGKQYYEDCVYENAYGMFQFYLDNI